MAEYLIIILLMTAGLVLLALELFLVPGFSVPGVAGLVLIGYAIFRTSMEYGYTGALIAFASGVGVTVLFIRIALHSRAIRVFGLEYSHHNPPEEKFRTALRGKTGHAITTLRPSGTALIDGIRVDVVTDGEYLSQGADIQVLSVEGMRVVVGAAHSSETVKQEIIEKQT